MKWAVTIPRPTVSTLGVTETPGSLGKRRWYVGMGNRPRIVLGDRDTDRRRSIASALQEDGYEVLEMEDGRDVLGYAEYLAAVMGRRRGNGAISADSFAIVADPELEGLSAPEVLEVLRRARWEIPMIILSAPAGREDLSRLRALLETRLRRTAPVN